MNAPPFVALPSAVVEPTENLSSDARPVGFLNDQLGDRSTDVSDDGRWLTYEELARIRGISSASAKRLVLRNGWRQRHDNEQGVRILVPPDRLSPGMSRISAAFGSVLAIIRDAHAGEISALREQLVEARCERDRERERANQAEASIAAGRRGKLGTARAVTLSDVQSAAAAVVGYDEIKRLGRMIIIRHGQPWWH